MKADSSYIATSTFEKCFLPVASGPAIILFTWTTSSEHVIDFRVSDMKATREERAADIEEKLLEQYGGRGTNSLPQTLMFDHVSPATRLLEKRRQMFEVQEALNSQKEEFSRREDAFRRREESLRRKDLELQESLIKFNKFLQENESKRKRALARTADEKKQREQKEKEIEEKEKELQETLEKEAQLKQQVDRNLKYQDFLENVVQTVSKFFPEISDVLQRHTTLREENLNLLKKKNQDEAEFDNKQREYINIRKAKENELLNKSNEVAELQKTLEQYKSRSMALQEEMDHLTQETAKKTKELGQIIASVGNLRERCEESFRIRHNKPQLDRSDKMSGLPLQEQCDKTKAKLEDIAMFMVDYQSIIVDYCSQNHDFRAVSMPRTQRNSSSSLNASISHGDDGHHSLAARSGQLSNHDGASMADTLR